MKVRLMCWGLWIWNLPRFVAMWTFNCGNYLALYLGDHGYVQAALRCHAISQRLWHMVGPSFEERVEQYRRAIYYADVNHPKYGDPARQLLKRHGTNPIGAKEIAEARRRLVTPPSWQFFTLDQLRNAVEKGHVTAAKMADQLKWQQTVLQNVLDLEHEPGNRGESARMAIAAAEQYSAGRTALEEARRLRAQE